MNAVATKIDHLDERLPVPDEVQSAKDLLAILAPLAERTAPAHVAIQHGDLSESFDLSPAVAHTLVAVLRHFSRGRAVTLVPVGATLTTQQAADILNVSRPYLIKLLDQGDLGHEKVGRHRRITTTELFAYKKRRDQKRRQALSDMAAMHAEEGLI